jgi:VWFA-related protein
MLRNHAIGLLLMSLAAGVAAQQVPNPPAPLQTPPPVHAGPVVLDVDVTDKEGHPIPGLQQSDFTLLDNGKPTAIDSFQAIGGAPGAQTEPVQAIIAVYEINTEFVAVSAERTQLHNFLTANGGHLPLPVTFIFVTTTGLQQVNQPSTDGLALDEAVRKQQSTLRTIPQSAGFYGGADRLQASMKALSSIISTIGPLPGRKLLLWISQGWWTFDNPNLYITKAQRKAFFSAIVQLSGVMREGRITLDSIDPWGTQDAGSFRNTQWLDFVKPVRDYKHANPGNLALQVVATQTGGLALYGSNDIAGEIFQSLSDGTAWYRLTFDPQRADAPNTWHDLAVKLDKGGLKVRTRNGYYAEP